MENSKKKYQNQDPLSRKELHRARIGEHIGAPGNPGGAFVFHEWIIALSIFDVA
jgi:hypothetical protein